MTRFPITARAGLIVLAVLLALPLAPIASPVEAKAGRHTVTRVFRNRASIALPIAQTAPVSASLYPSPIVVSGLKGTIRDVNVTLTGVDHGRAGDLEMLLVGPHGQTAIVLAEVGGDADVDGVTLRLDDEAAAPLPLTPLHGGTFRPTNVEFFPIAFNAPAPPVTSANAALSVFDGTNPNGTWRLFVQDDFGPNASGTIDGWTLEITAKVKTKKKKRR